MNGAINGAILEADGALHPIEVKKSAIVDISATQAFKVLDNGRLARGTGAVVCTKEALAAVDSNTFDVPVWVL